MSLKRTSGAGSPKLWTPAPFRILALDPGGTTGWAYCDWIPDNPNTTQRPTSLTEFEFSSGHIGPGEHHSELWNFLDGTYFGTSPRSEEELPPFELVYESFEFRQHINKDQAKHKVELISKEYIGVIKLFAQTYNIPIHEQTASAAKTFIPDKGPQANVKLKQLGVYEPVTHWPHAMDAMRHLLRHMVVTMKMRSPITDAWLNE